MGLFSTINIAASGMSVERLRSDVIADNIANANSTRTAEGGAYKRSRIIVEPVAGAQFRGIFTPEEFDAGAGQGVRVAAIEKDESQGRLVYDPTHPDAIMSGPNVGYVEYPNINIVSEMVDLIAASRAYEANSSVIQGSKEMFQQALAIGQ
ncbi:MAG: flagellar basal body rod protein FlgC [Treponemataceae bacterium]|nr:flagellar basal body rod protein FlgC [Treponemataceae bacterium]